MKVYEFSGYNGNHFVCIVMIKAFSERHAYEKMAKWECTINDVHYSFSSLRWKKPVVVKSLPFFEPIGLN